MSIDILHEKFDLVDRKLKNRINKTTINLNDIDLDIDNQFYEFQERSAIVDFLLPDLKGYYFSSNPSISTKSENEILRDLNLETYDILNE